MRLLLLLSLPCLFWAQGPDTAPALKEAKIGQLCAAPDQVDTWKKLGFTVNPLTPEALAAREAVLPPGTAPRAGVASPTRTPWINANGWRFVREPAKKYVYEAPPGRAALAAAEAYAYGADAVLKVDPKDLPALGDMLAFLAALPAADLPRVADLSVVDDGSPITGEVMNLLSRRNLMFEAVKAPSKKHAINIKVGDKAYPIEEAADPSKFALKIRRQLTDEKRSLRLYGSEVIIGHLTGDGSRRRLHLLNYGGRPIEGLRVRVLGTWKQPTLYIAGATDKPAVDGFAVSEGGTEFTLPRITTYTVIDLAK